MFFEAAGASDGALLPPVFADDLLLCSRPVSYLELRAEPTDGKTHRLEAEICASEELCLTPPVRNPDARKGAAERRHLGRAYGQRRPVGPGQQRGRHPHQLGLLFSSGARRQADFRKVRGETLPPPRPS